MVEEGGPRDIYTSSARSDQDSAWQPRSFAKCQQPSLARYYRNQKRLSRPNSPCPAAHAATLVTGTKRCGSSKMSSTPNALSARLYYLYLGGIIKSPVTPRALSTNKQEKRLSSRRAHSLAVRPGYFSSRMCKKECPQRHRLPCVLLRRTGTAKLPSRSREA